MGLGKTMSHFDMMRKSRRHISLAFALCALALIWSGRLLGPDTAQLKVMVLDHVPLPYHPISAEPTEQKLDLSHLQHLVRTPTFEYSRRVIRTQHFNGDRPDLTRINEKLTPPAITVHKTNMSSLSIPNMPALTLQVPRSPQVDTSIFSFGMATTIPRLKISIAQISHWLAHSGSQIHVSAPLHQDSELVESQMHNESINATITPSNIPFAKAYFSLIKTLYESRTSKTQYIVLADDDTFFPSLPSLASHLSQKYNSADPLLIAATSDNLGQIHAFGFLPFGGGGVFISIPLAAQFLQPNIWEGCIKNTKTQGDQIVNDCLNSFSSVKPTFDSLLHQMDISGDTAASAPEAGYFESGRQMLSLHHWRSWFNFDVAKAAIVAKACGNEGLFQRWIFAGESEEGIVLSNGYSIVEYPQGITEEELKGVEYTWHQGDEEERWRYVHTMGPLRRMKMRDEKKTKMLLETVEVSAPEGKGIRQVYIEKVMEKDGDTVESVKDRVVELLWLI